MIRTLSGLIISCTVLVGAARADLVHYYSFDRRAADDSVGNEDGTINGNPTFEAGATGEATDLAIQLNEEGTGANDDFVSFEPTEFGDAFSITAWIRPSGEQENQMMAIAANTHGGFAGPDGFKWTVQQWNVYDESLRLETGDTITGTNDGVTGIILEDEWQHVAIAFDKEILSYEMFHNGASVRTGGILEFGDDHPWQIGAFRAPDGGATNAGFIGLIDAVGVFDHLLTEDEVLEIFENGIDVPNTVAGDFNDDGSLTDIDIDLLSAEVRAASNNPLFDLNNDALVDQTDHRVWVEDLKVTYFGDSNLDSEFNSGDLVAVFQAGEFEDGIAGNSKWATGDWNGDGDFGSGDLVLAFQSGGYEQGPRTDGNAIPEPATTTLALFCVLLVAARRRAFAS